MSDKIKLIIEIDKDKYERCKERKLWSYDAEILEGAVAMGIPLDDVKTEIDKSQEPYKTSTAYDEGVRFGLMLAYQIIDKYKAESEDK